MTFYSYMQRVYRGKPSPAGALARHMLDDREGFPRNNPNAKYTAYHDLTREYLERAGASPSFLDAFEKCWAEYEATERKRRKTDA